jgi:hypothetical protein
MSCARSGLPVHSRPLSQQYSGVNYRAAILTIIMALPLSTSGAQVHQLKRGEKIRFSIGATRELHEARLERFTPDSMILESCATCNRLRFARREAYDLEVFRRKSARSRAVTGFGIGGLFGLAAAGIRGLSCHGTADKCEDWFFALPFFGLIGGFVGSIVGYLGAGAWQPIALEGGAR